MSLFCALDIIHEHRVYVDTFSDLHFLWWRGKRNVILSMLHNNCTTTSCKKEKWNETEKEMRLGPSDVRSQGGRETESKDGREICG